jgi:hypothetical protein
MSISLLTPGNCFSIASTSALGPNFIFRVRRRFDTSVARLATSAIGIATGTGAVTFCVSGDLLCSFAGNGS